MNLNLCVQPEMVASAGIRTSNLLITGQALQPIVPPHMHLACGGLHGTIIQEI